MHADPVIIAGGSLAGIAAALRLKQLGVKTLILEKGSYPRHKLCGEFLGPDSFAALRQIGLWDAVYAAACRPVSEARFHAPPAFRARPLVVPMAWLNANQPYGLGISRSQLDSIFADYARSQGLTILEHNKVIAVEQTDRGFAIETRDATGEAKTYRTRAFINAAGRHGGIRQAAGQADLYATKPVETLSTLVGFKANVRLALPSQDKTLQMVFFPGGYGGIQPLTPEIHNVCFLMQNPKDVNAKVPFAEFIAQTIGQNTFAAEHLAGAEPVEPLQTTAQLNQQLTDPHTTPWINIGDAMITIDPVTGSGMTLALQSGILASEILANGFRYNRPYTDIKLEYEQGYRRQFGLRLACLKQFRPFLFSAPLQKALWPLASLSLPGLARLFR